MKKLRRDETPVDDAIAATVFADLPRLALKAASDADLVAELAVRLVERRANLGEEAAGERPNIPRKCS